MSMSPRCDRLSIGRNGLVDGRAPGVSVAPPRNLESPPIMSELTADHAVETRRSSYRATALIIASALFMEQLDGTVLATALPTMAAHFAVSPSHMSIALTSYLLSLAVLIPASGNLADRFGARTVFSSAIAIFTVGSILCAQAPNLATLVVARLLQGAGGAMMVPVGRLVLLRSVDKRDLVSAMSWFLVPAMTGPILGRPSAASSSPTSTGAGSSTSTCRSASLVSS